jgi:hypothetical protein
MHRGAMRVSLRALASRLSDRFRDTCHAAARRPALALASVVVAVPFATLFAIALQSLLGPIYGEHDWRQGWTYSVAYAFVHENASFFYPKHAWRGHLTGIVGMEPPIYPYLISLLMRAFGDSPAIGRIVNFVLFIAGFGLLGKRLGQQTGFPTVLGYLTMAAFSPVALCEFRQIQPDPAMTSLALLAAVFFHEHGATGTRKSFGVGLLIYTIALLTKPIAIAVFPAMFLFAIMGPKRPTLLGSVLRLACFAIPLGLMFAWEKWANLLVARYMEGHLLISIDHDPAAMWENMKNVGARRRILLGLLENWVTHVSLFPAVLLGIPYSLRKETRSWSVPFLAWCAGMIAISLAFAGRYWSNWYYMLLFAPPVLFFGAVGLGRVFEVVGMQTREPWHRGIAFGAVFASLLVMPQLHPVPWSYIGRAPEQLAVHIRQGVSGSELYWIALAGSFLGAASLVALRDQVERVPGLIISLVVGAAFAWSLTTPYKDMKQTARWYTGEEYWVSGHVDSAEIRRAVSRYSTPRDLFLMNGANPALLVRALRVGYAEDPRTIDSVGRDFYVGKGVRFFMSFFDSGAMPAALQGAQLLERGARWELFCIDPKGCPPLQS